MTIIVFLIDTSASMMQKTYLGTTYLDYAKLVVEQFLKLRQRDPASNGDRYMLMSFEEYPQNIKSGWKESQRIFNEQLKNLKARGSMNFESSLESVLRLLMVSRMQSGSGAGIETFGFGRYPSYAEHVVIIPVIDGSTLPPNNPEARVPKPRLLIGSDLYLDGYRWDQRLFPVVIRLAGQHQPIMQTQSTLIPLEDNSIAQNFSEQMGGRSFSINSHRSLGSCIDQIIQRIQANGVLIRMQKCDPDTPPPQNATENNQSKPEEEDRDNAWKNSLVLLKSKIGQQHSHWPIPEAFWPDSIKNALPPRTAHPIITFKCERVDPLFNTEFPLDKYELENSSPLAQYILSKRESNLCWQVFVENSYRQSGNGFPFGYIKISTSSSVTLYVMPYNYPELLGLLSLAKESKVANTLQFRQKFDRYLSTVPAYYYSGLKKALNRIKVMPPSLEEANTKLYGYCNLGALQMRIKNQGQQEYETACSAVYKNLQESSMQFQNSNLLIKVSRSRAQLGKSALTDCIFRPAVAMYKANIPADGFKDLSIFLLESPPQTAIPSLQFKNPFDISRENLCSQLDKMRLNYEQQVQTNNLHVLEGGLPGQKIKLQHAEDLHNLPISKMGIYEEYMKSLNAIGLGPKRELEPQAARPHAFGNPFKLDKKNMSIVDEVGEMNATADGTMNTSGGNNNGGSSTASDRRERKRAASEGPTGSTALLVRPKRRPGPLDPNRLASWKRRRRSLSIGSDDTGFVVSADFYDDIRSAPDEHEIGELRLVEMEEEEEDEYQEQNQPETTPEEENQDQRFNHEIIEDFRSDGTTVHLPRTNENNQFVAAHSTIQESEPPTSPKYESDMGIVAYERTEWENNVKSMGKGGKAATPLLGTDSDGIIIDAAAIMKSSDASNHVCSSSFSSQHLVQCRPSTSDEQQIVLPATDVNNHHHQHKSSRKRAGKTLTAPNIPHPAPLPTLSETEIFFKKCTIRQLIRQIGPRNEQLHSDLMEIITDRALSRDRQRELLELGHLEAKMFKRQKLVELLEWEMKKPTTTTRTTPEKSMPPGGINNRQSNGNLHQRVCKPPV